MTIWLVIILVGVGTYCFRAAMFVVVGERDLPAWTARPLSFVGAAAIGALVGGMMLTEAGRFAPSGTVELVAAATAFVTVQRTGNVAHALLVGLPMLWLLG